MNNSMMGAMTYGFKNRDNNTCNDARALFLSPRRAYALLIEPHCFFPPLFFFSFFFFLFFSFSVTDFTVLKILFP